LTLNFKGFFGNEALTFNELKSVTNSGDTLNFTRISFLLSDFKLEKSNGEIIALNDTNAFISLGINRNLLTFKENVPKGEFKKIHFKIGLDSVTNHADPSQYSLTHPLNPIVNQMHWDWAGGYIFMVAEGHFMNNENSNPIFTYHMANLEYVKLISLTFENDLNLSISRTLEIGIDMKNYFESPNKHSIKNDGNSSHSNSSEDRNIMNKLHENLNTVFKIIKS
jgi:hypothetical protein